MSEVEEKVAELQDESPAVPGVMASDKNRAANSPLAMATSVLRHRAASVAEEVESAISFSQGLDDFDSDGESLKQFVEELENAKLLSPAEVQKALAKQWSKGTISKLRKIRDYKDVILDERVLPFLSAGYSTLYEVILLRNVLDKYGDGTQRLHEFLKGLKGRASRGVVKQERDQHEKPAVAPDSPAPQSDDGDYSVEPSLLPEVKEDIQLAPEDKVGRLVAEDVISHHAEIATVSSKETSAKRQIANDGWQKRAHSDAPQPQTAIETTASQPTDDDEGTKTPVAAILMTPSAWDASLIAQGKMPRSFRALKERLDAAAVLIVHAELGILNAISAGAHSLGFDHCSRIYMLSQPTEPDVVGSEVLAVFGMSRSIPEPHLTWPIEDQDAVKLADHVLEGIDGRRVHLFAGSSSDNWESASSLDLWGYEIQLS